MRVRRSDCESGRTSRAGCSARSGVMPSWTSSATHAILPLLATDAGIGLQLQTGIESHRRRFGGWDGGLWLPECAYAPWLDTALERAGVRAACVELTNALGLGSERHLTPVRSADGPVLWPIDRAVIALAWGQGGYPSRPPYRDYHAYTTHRHRVRRIDGGAYDHGAATRQARADAAEFVAAVRERVRRGGVCVFAVDTELLGHWWYEGVQWLDAVLDEADRQGLALTTLDEARAHHDPVPAAADLGSTSWGEGGDLRTWSGPKVAAFAWRARAAELALAATPGRADQRPRAQRAAGAAVVRLGVPGRPRARRRLPGAAGAAARRGVRARTLREPAAMRSGAARARAVAGRVGLTSAGCAEQVLAYASTI